MALHNDTITLIRRVFFGLFALNLSNNKVDLRRYLVPLIVLFLWQYSSYNKLVDPLFIPSPMHIINSMFDWIFGTNTHDLYSGTWINHAMGSIRRVIAGFFIGAIIGILLGIMTGWNQTMETLFDPMIQLLRPIPITAWVPFMVVLFGIKDISAILLISLGVFFPVVVNTVHGVKQIDKIHIRAAQMLGIRGLQIISKVVFPAAFPFIMTGLRLGMGMAWVLVIVAEMVSVKSGLGYVMWDAYYFMRMDIIIVAMLSVGVLGYLFDKLIVIINDRMLRWTKGLKHR